MALDDFFKQKKAFAEKNYISTIDMFPIIRCQKQLPNKFQQPESLCSSCRQFIMREKCGLLMANGFIFKELNK